MRGSASRSHRALSAFAARIGRVSLAAATIILAAIAAVHAAMPAPEMPFTDPLEYGDTVVVWGPYTPSAGWDPEWLLLNKDPNRQMLIKVVNGDPDGSNRVTDGSVRIGGVSYVSAAEFATGAGEWIKVVSPQDTASLGMTTTGPAGAHMTVSILETADPSVTLMNERFYAPIDTGTYKYKRTITIPAGVGAPFVAIAQNGNSDGTQRIKSFVFWHCPPGVQLLGLWNASYARLASEFALLATDTIKIEYKYLMAGGFGDVIVKGRDIADPVLTLTSPAANLITRDTIVTVSGTVLDSTATVIRVNGVTASLGSGDTWSVDLPLEEGLNTFNITAIDAAGNQTDTSRVVTRDQTPPNLTITTPSANGYTADANITLAGTVFDSTTITLNVNGTPVSVDGSGNWSTTVAVPNESNVYVVSASDAVDNVTSAIRVMGRDLSAPTVTLSSPTQNDTTDASAIDVIGTIVDSSSFVVTVNGDTVPVVTGSFSKMVNLLVGTNTVLVIATDVFGNDTTVSRTVVRTAPGSTLPPDPASVAPALDPTLPMNLHAATQFLWTGEDPIQTGVVEGAISPKQVAILRGKVLNPSAAALTDVTVKVVNHPELGQTRTRSDGLYDIGTNGGGSVTLEFTKAGYLPVQRSSFPIWQRWVTLDSIVMMPLDTNVTTIDFSDSVEVARGGVITDSAGTRQATLMFKMGTTAQMLLPNGSMQSLSSLGVRATEFTQGSLGLAAMPAALPPSTAYTYAVELSTDEALAAGAREVLFSAPVSFYVDNFLGFPIGTVIPVGYYDRDLAAWKPEPDGRVISIHSVTGDLANIAVTSAGTAASQAVLDSLGFTTSERRQLASLYSVGKTLWRAQHTHFSSVDYNLPPTPPDHAKKPNFDPTRGDKFDSGSCQKSGSIICTQNQKLGEQLAIAGTPFSLSYSSDRSFGFRSQRRITIPEQPRIDTSTIASLGGAIVRNGAPGHVQRAEYVLKVAGREIRHTPTIGSTAITGTTLEWDGLDAAGRRVNGEQLATISVDYHYADRYGVRQATSAAPARSFGAGLLPGSTASSFVARRTIPLTQVWSGAIGGYDASAQAMGGWTLSAHHAYNPATGTLYHGDGSRREAEAIGRSVRTLLSTGSNDIAVAPNGEFFLAFPGGGGTGPNVQRYLPDGTGLGRYVGHPTVTGFSPDGTRADSASLTSPNAIAFGPDGRLYIADGNTNRIRRVDPDGRLRTYAGTGSSVSSGDGGQALSAGISNPRKLAFLPDGSLIFLENGSNVLRKIAPNGIVSRFAGTGTFGYTGDNGPATSANLFLNAQGVALAAGPDGSVYVSQVATFMTTRRIVRRIRPNGIIETVAGINQLAGTTPARQIIFGEIADIDVTAEGELLISTAVRLYGVAANGGLRVVAGSSGRCVFASQVFICDPVQAMTRGLALQFRFGGMGQVKASPDGSILIQDSFDNRTRSISPALPSFAENDLLVASEDGGAVYQFNEYGRHLRTIDALSRDTLLTFGYDSVGRVITVTDADGRVTTIQRTSGVATAIVAPDGQTTDLGYDEEGFLAEVTNDAGERVQLVTSETGLLTRLTDPRGGQYAFAYDSLGRLLSDSSAAGQVQTLSRVETDTSSVVTYGDGEGRTTVYRLDRLGGTAQKRTITNPAGLVTVSTTFANDSSVTVAPDSTTMMVVRGGDTRFGSQAPVLKRAETRLPSGLTSVVTASRTATLSNAADPLSLTTLLDSVRVNNRVYRSLYTRSTRTLLTTSPAGRTTTTVYDTAGRVLRTTVPGLDSAIYAYDAQGRLTSAQSGGRVSTFAYDTRGRLKSTTDPLGRNDSLFYDDADRLTRRVLPDGRDVEFAYDSSGNLTSVTPPGQPAHTFTYAPADRLATYNPPTAGLPVSATSYGYNAAGQVTVIRRPTGDSLRFTYDGAGRPASVVFDRGTLGFTFNSTTGNLTSLSAPGGLGLAFTYDGSLPKSVTWSGTVSGSTAVSYDTDFRVTSQTVNGANSVSFGYDLDGLLTTAGALGLNRDATNGRLDADSITVASQIQRNAYGYDNHGALASLLSRRGTDTLFRTSYTRDSVSRITSLVEVVNGTTQTVAFTYDSVGRLKTVTRNGTTTASYTYDLNGNRATKVTAGGTETASIDAQDRLLSYGSASYHYTANGEVRRRIVGADTTVYAYDAQGNLTQVDLADGTEIRYLIDAMNRRIGKLVNDTLVRAWLYQGQLTPVAELNGSGAIVSRFVYATGVNVPDYMVRGDSTYRLVRDHLGSVRVVVNVASGTIAQRLAYDEFGIETENTNPAWQPFGYAGGLTDLQTGLIRFGARDYDPQSGRWTAKDPVGFAGGTTSLYSYAANDPINAFDPTGQILETVLDVVSFGLSLWDFIKCPSWANAGWLAADAAGLLLPFVPAVGTIRHINRATDALAPGTRQLVIGRGKDLDKVGALAPNERRLSWPSKLPDYSAEWKENAGRLRSEMRTRQPIRDASPGDLEGPFLEAERNLLRDRGWSFDARTSMWNPPPLS